MTLQCLASAACDAQESACRGMALLPGIGFVSASHDCTLRVWDAGGALLAELVCRTPLVNPAGLYLPPLFVKSATVYRTLCPRHGIRDQQHD